MIGAEGFLTGAGSGARRIFWRSWRPDGAGTPPAVIVLVHGASEHSGRYEHVASVLTDSGYPVYALDHRGHGRSEGARALLDRLGDAVADIDTLVDQACAEHPGREIVMLGHSMGGTLAISYAVRHQERLAGLILSGPLAALDAAPAPLRLVGRVLSAVAPSLPLIAIDASAVSRDPEVVRDYVDDPLNHHGKLPARTVDELARAIDDFPQAVTTITVPTLILYGTADTLAPPSGAQMVAERIGSADVTTIPYEGLFHEILNEPERESVLTDIRGWLAERFEVTADSGASGGASGATDVPAGA